LDSFFGTTPNPLFLLKRGKTINVPPLKESGWGDLEQEKGENRNGRFNTKK